MKKIRSINQLRAEKKRIRGEAKELEGSLRDQWIEFRQSLSARGMLKDAYISVLKNKTAKNLYGGNILKSTVAFGVSLLFNKLVRKAGEKFAGIFEKDKKQPEPAD